MVISFIPRIFDKIYEGLISSNNANYSVDRSAVGLRKVYQRVSSAVTVEKTFRHNSKMQILTARNSQHDAGVIHILH